MALETKLVTAEELFRMPDDGSIVELVDGEIRKMTPADAEHGRIADRFAISLGAYVRQHGLGVTMAAETGFIIRRDPDTVRAPDYAFVRKDRWNHPEAYFIGPPDLAVEVISPNDTYTEVSAKVIEWLESGVQIVIVIDPSKQRAEIHRSLTERDPISIDGTLDAANVIPGWSLALRDLFVP